MSPCYLLHRPSRDRICSAFTSWCWTPRSRHRQLAHQVGARAAQRSLFITVSSLDGGSVGSVFDRACDLVWESQVQSNRQRLAHAAPLDQTKSRCFDTIAPTYGPFGPTRARSAHGATQGGSSQLPLEGRGWRTATCYCDARRHIFATTGSNGAPWGSATEPSPFPPGTRTPAATYASSVSTNMSAYEDLPGHHLISIRNLVMT